MFGENYLLFIDCLLEKKVDKKSKINKKNY